MSARERILARVRASTERRERTPHPGDFEGWRPEPLDGFRALFEAAGGTVVDVDDVEAAGAWLAEFVAGLSLDDARARGEAAPTAAVGETVPDTLRPALASADPAVATIGVSLARAAVEETGSLVMDARDGRRAQLLVPIHVVFVRAEDVFPTLRDALRALKDDLPSAIGLHSGPSKSADIGQIMVKGVHGPGRVVAVVIGRSEE